MHYEPDTAGLALKKARFSKPLRRATAERLAAEIQARAGNAARQRLAYEIVEVHLFGSAADPLRVDCGDVDIAVGLAPRYPLDLSAQFELERRQGRQHRPI
jgi:predicted nucleotidyltransferase